MALIRMDKSISTPQAVAPSYSLPSYEGGEDENRGGLRGGVGYLGEKLAVGAVQSIEGISDFLIGGAAKLFGFDKFAERQFVNDWFGDWYSHPDEWFNPSDSWKVAGDIAGGIGSSLPTLVAGALTGGAGMFATAALSSAGNATKEAYMQTGKLGGKEFAYGALTGVLEGSMEAITNKIGLGTSAILESFGISFAKNVSKSAISQGIGTFAKAFAGEAFEEAVAEIMSAPFKRLTYDKNAEFASADEILYAAFVGGMSGVVMNGVGVSFASARNISRGNQAVEAGQVEEIMERAKEHSKIADESGIEKGIIKQVSDTYKKLAASLKKTNGEVKTVAQRRMLGELKIGNVAALTAPRIYKAAATIASDPDTFIEKINAYGYTDANGKPITVTKEQLMQGIDVKDLKGSIPKALETNETLRNIVMMSAAGEIFMNVSKFQESVLRGEKFAGDADIENLLKQGKPEEIQAMQNLLGLGDLHNVNPDAFNRKIAELEASGKLDELYNKYKANGGKIDSIPTINPEKNANLGAEAQNISQNVAKPLDNEAGVRYAKSNTSPYKKISKQEHKKLSSIIMSKNSKNMAENIELDRFSYAYTDKYFYVYENFAPGKFGVLKQISLVDENIAQVREIRENIGVLNETETITSAADANKMLKVLQGSRRNNSSNNAIDSKGRTDSGNGDISSGKRESNRVGNVEEGGGYQRNVKSDGEQSGYTGHYVDRGPKALIQESPIKIVHSFTDIAGRKRNVVRISSTKYMIEGDSRSKYQPSIEATVEAENRRIIERYARKANLTVGMVKYRLERNSDFLIKERKKGVRFALSDTDSDTIDTSDSVSKGEATEGKSMTVIESATFAKENVPEYKELNADDQARIRRLIRQAKANGFTDKQTRAYARVSARSGIDIVFDKERLYRGNGKYADGLYSHKQNKIFVNPEGSRSPARLLIHELTHALYNDRQSRVILDRGAKNLTEDQKKEIWNKYFPDAEFDENNIIFKDELSSHYTEALLDDDALLEKLCNDNPTLKDKILSFFKKAITGYSDEPNLSREAKKLYKRYKTLFDSFSERNQYGEIKGDGERHAYVGENAKRTYTYGELILKEDLNGIIIDKTQQVKVIIDKNGNKKIDSDDIIKKVQAKCKKITTTSDNPTYYVKAEDIGKNVEITNKSIKHGFIKGLRTDQKTIPDNALTTARVSLELPYILENAIEVNISERSDNNDVPYSHIMIGTVGLENDNKTVDYYAVRLVVEERINQSPILAEAKIISKLHAMNAKKIDSPTTKGIRKTKNPRVSGGVYSYSISHFLDDVNSIFDDTFSQDVYKHFGRQRETNSFSTHLRYALPDTDTDTVDTSDSVGKKRQQYKASIKERIFTAADSIYIDIVDELYGVTKYLTKVGKIKDAASAVQAVRASAKAAETMLADVQCDIFSDDGKKLGDGLSKIIKPITVKGEKITNSFNEYLLHWLNIDRMSLEERSLAELEGLKTTLREDIEKLREVNGKLAEAKAKKQSMFSDSEVQQSLDKTIKKLEKMQKEMRKSIKEQKRRIDNFVVMENKPVFGENEKRLNAITAEQSRKKIAEMEKVHPDFKAVAEKVWAYTKNLNHMRVEAGLISAESEAYMNELYPHYVPSNRDLSYSGVGAIKGKRNLEISSTVKRAKGGGENVLDVFDSIALQTQELLRAGRINQLFRKIYDVAVESGDNTYVEVISKEKVSRADSASMQADSIEIRPKGNQITGFIDGEKVTLKVTDEIFIAFDNMSKPTVDPTSALGKGAQRLNDIYKKLLTSYSPAFLIRNPIRDLQDAGLNSKHSILFAKNLKKAVETMLKNGEAWQIYRAYGGYSASIFGPEGFSANVDSRGFEAMAKLFDSDEVTIKTVYEAAKRSGKNLLTGINNLNAFVEQATRFAEYLASIEAGESIPVAINNAAEVTTNFGRRGRLTKKMNATIMPFLNPSIQGFDKIFRNVTDAFKEGTPTATAKALANLLGKAAVIGLAPMLVNMLLYGDDDDYEKLREADKENNFLIKVGDTFIKIPRGRLASVIGGTANRGSKLIKGEDADLKDYAENVINQVTPVGNLTRTILSPFFDVKNNRTWYGGEIEGRQFDNTAPKDRYDESTSSWAIAIGKVINYSPKKIHYLLDQYMGVIGDFVLPATSKKASKDFFSGNFTIDPATSNKLSTSFYKIYDKAQYAKTAGDDTAIYQVKYLNKVKDAISDMYDKKSEIQNNSELSKVEKLQQSRVVQILINQAYETALADIDRYTQAFKATEGIESTSLFKSAFGTEATEATVQKMRYTEATRYMYGAKKALEEYDDAVYAKCELLNLAGVDYDKLYYYYFSTKGLTSDTDRRGNVISGSKKKKVIAAVNALGVSREQRLLLIASKGYSLTDSEKKRLLSYILKLKTTKEKRIELAELCGFTVRNGKIVADFK